ncbi:MAG TPA: NTF2-like N-terminal transpeptidase domain-containing protein, partial [Candidatus Limnocylindria bacterium]|nr:NTF2-like N-terminal transpeptidase domain-containing protein [Candidatus Limnocylindria bacterium]
MRSLIPLLYVALAVASACEALPPSPDPVAKQYAEAWAKSHYQEMWDLLTEESRERVGTEGFIDRLPRIAEEMTLRSLEVTTGPSTRGKLPNGSPDPRNATVPLDVTFHTTRVGDFKRSTTLSLVLVGEKDRAVWRISWSPEAIMPALSPGRLVRMTRIDTSRGVIRAREGTELATFIDGSTIGVIPGQVRSEDGLALSLAPIVGLTPDQIKAKLHQPWV